MAVFDDLTVLLKYQNDPRNAQAVGRGRKQLTGLKSSALATGLAVGGIALASTLAFRKIYQLGREAVKTFAEVESNLSTIEGLVGISAQQLAEWGPALQEIRRVSGRDLAELSRGLYDITSAGLRGDVALEALDVSARAERRRPWRNARSCRPAYQRDKRLGTGCALCYKGGRRSRKGSRTR